jgi:hypothetical protein
MIPDHEWLMLKTGSTNRSNGTVVAYLAPNFEVVRQAKNDLHAAARARGRASIVRDNLVVLEELTIQGSFMSSLEVPAAHRSALEALFSTSAEVTPDMQANRLLHYLVRVGGGFQLYHGAREYRASTEAAINYPAGVFPQVGFQDYSESGRSGRNQRVWVLKFAIGLERSSS